MLSEVHVTCKIVSEMKTAGGNAILLAAFITSEPEAIL
jgi:hypothetical protein